MSDMRRAARRLVEPRSESFESRHALAESRRRVQAALAKLAEADRDFGRAWSGDDAHPVLTVTFPVSPATQRLLKLLSVAMGLLVAAAAGSWLAADRALAWMATITAVLAFLGFPFVVLGLASHQDARDARIGRAIRAALKEDGE